MTHDEILASDAIRHIRRVLEENEVERISFDLSILFSKKINRETLPIVNKVTLNKPNMR